MKLICTQENLKLGLTTVGRIISPSNTLPILNNILLKTENGILKISSTNLEVAVTTEVRCKVEEEGGVTVFSKTFIELVNNLPNKNITLETKNGELSLETENYHTTVKTLPADEFPLIPEIEDKQKIEIEGQELKKAIDQVVFAVSTNLTQPELSGVMFNTDGQTLKLAATDRYRLAEKKTQLAKRVASEQVIVPQKTALEVSRIVGPAEGVVEVVISETQISFSFGQTHVISRLVDGQFPDYEHIIPQDFKTIVHLSKQGLVNALRAGGIFSQGSNSVELEYNTAKQILTILAQSQDLGNSVVDIPSQIEGGDGKLILNHRYILDSLSGMETDNVIIKMIDDSAPTLLFPEGKNDYMCLIMPIKS